MNQTSMLSDCWLFNPLTLTWTMLAQVGKADRSLLPSPRAFFLLLPANSIDNIVVLNGGESARHTVLSDIWIGVISLTSITWVELATPNSVPLMRHAGIVSDVFTGLPTLFTFGGASATSSSQTGSAALTLPQFFTNSIIMGCNVGSYRPPSASSLACLDCPKGTYSDSAGATECMPCPHGTSTRAQGAMSMSACDLCDGDFCSGNGDCYVDATTHAVICKCRFGYGGSSCNLSTLGIGLGSAFGALLIIVLFLGARAFFRRRIYEVEKYASLQEKLLEAQTTELLELEQAWEIRYSELQMGKELGAGACGQVGVVC